MGKSESSQSRGQQLPFAEVNHGEKTQQTQHRIKSFRISPYCKMKLVLRMSLRSAKQQNFFQKQETQLAFVSIDH